MNCQGGENPSPVNLIEGKNVVKDKFANSVSVNLNWGMKIEDPLSKFDID